MELRTTLVTKTEQKKLFLIQIKYSVEEYWNEEDPFRMIKVLASLSSHNRAERQLFF